MSNILVDEAWNHLLSIDYEYNDQTKIFLNNKDEPLVIHNEKNMDNIKHFLKTIEKHRQNTFLKQIVDYLIEISRNYNNLHTCHSHVDGSQLTYHEAGFMAEIHLFVKKNKILKGNT